MNLLAVLAAALRMGTTAIPGAVLYEWEVIYQDGVVVPYQTSTEVLDLTPRQGVPFTLRVRADGGTWSDPSYQVVADPLPGDNDLDCVVGIPDYGVLAQHFGQRCQP